MKICATMKKFPGGMMVIPLLIGYLVDTFIPQVLETRGPAAGLFKTRISTLVGLFILCSNAAISSKQAAPPLYKGAVLTILKYAIGVLSGLGLNRLFGPMGILGLTLLAVIIAIINSSGVIYTILAKKFGDNAGVGVIAILLLNDGPFLTIVALGTTGLAEIPILSLVAAIVPLITGVILGNLDEGFKMLLPNGLAMLPPPSDFVLEASTSLSTIAEADAGGIALGLITVLFTGVLTHYLYNLVRGKPDPTGMAIGVTGGNAVAVPVSVAMAGPSLESVMGVATAQVAGAVVITAIPIPILTGFFARETARRQQKN